MKKADITEKQSREREEWQKRGFGGLVNNVDAASSTISVTVPSQGEKKTVAVHLSKDTILRRYAMGSVKFDDAKPAPLDQIKPGDQLRARGTRSADGTELTAIEIVSGTFRNIAGTISTIDTSAGTITVQDLVAKKPITVRITPESQLRKLRRGLRCECGPITEAWWSAIRRVGRNGKVRRRGHCRSATDDQSHARCSTG